MEKIKKISLFLVLVLILSICFYTKTYAALSCSVSMSASSNEVTEGNEFTVSIGVNNIQGDKGVIIYGGTVEYDKNVLTCTGKSGAGEWAPSFNKENGKFVADRDNGFAKSNETVLKLTFKVNDGASGSTTITVKDALASDGTEDKSAGTAKTTISIKAKDNGNKDEDKDQGTNQGGNQGGSTSGNKKPTSSGNKKPTPNKVVSATTEPKNEESTTEDTNTIENTVEENTVDENNIIKNEINIFDNEQEYVEEDNQKSNDKTNTILIISLAVVLVILAILGIVIFIKKQKLKD